MYVYLVHAKEWESSIRCVCYTEKDAKEKVKSIAKEYGLENEEDYDGLIKYYKYEVKGYSPEKSHDTKAYSVHDYEISSGVTWSGYVIDTTGEGVEEAIKRKFGLNYLRCVINQDEEGKFICKNNQQCFIKEVDANRIPMSELTVGELIGILHNLNV